MAVETDSVARLDPGRVARTKWTERATGVSTIVMIHSGHAEPIVRKCRAQMLLALGPTFRRFEFDHTDFKHLTLSSIKKDRNNAGYKQLLER